MLHAPGRGSWVNYILDDYMAGGTAAEVGFALPDVTSLLPSAGRASGPQKQGQSRRGPLNQIHPGLGLSNCCSSTGCMSLRSFPDALKGGFKFAQNQTVTGKPGHRIRPPATCINTEISNNGTRIISGEWANCDMFSLHLPIKFPPKSQWGQD